MPGSVSFPGADQPMRVLYLVPPGGWPDHITAYSFLDEEIHALADSGVEPYLLSPAVDTFRQSKRVRLLPLPQGSPWERWRALRFLAAYRSHLPTALLKEFGKFLHATRIELAAADLIKQHDIQLIHSHFGPILGFGGMLARLSTGRPLVSSFRGMDLLVDRGIDYGLRRDAFYDRSLSALLRNVDVSTYASDFMRGEAIRLGARRETAVTIRKGVDLNHFHVPGDRETLRRELGVETPMILTVAGLIPRKGVGTVLRALALLLSTHKFTLVVCGDGPERGALEGLSDRLAIADRVVFKGRIGRAEIPQYFAACDVFVLASLVEAAGNVVLEAMASGRPVVCTDSGGPPEYVRDGKTGYIVPVGDHVRMAERIALLLDAPELADRLGRAGRAVAERELVYENMTRAFLQLYEELTVRHATDSTPIKASA
jgi:glycosyltransferase involved in cell wall biosynthesis